MPTDDAATAVAATCIKNSRRLFTLQSDPSAIVAAPGMASINSSRLYCCRKSGGECVYCTVYGTRGIRHRPRPVDLSSTGRGSDEPNWTHGAQP